MVRRLGAYRQGHVVEEGVPRLGDLDPHVGGLPGHDMGAALDSHRGACAATAQGRGGQRQEPHGGGSGQGTYPDAGELHS